MTLLIAPLSILCDNVDPLINEERNQARGEGPNWRIRLIERRGRQHLTGRRKNETEMMRETVGGSRRMLSLLQAPREDAAAAAVAISISIATRLDLRDPGYGD